VSDEPQRNMQDPTALTRDLVRHALLQERELTDAKIVNLGELFRAELEGIVKLLAEADRRYDERFAAADLRYQQRYDASDKALAAASLAAKEAVNAALAAAKEAVASQNESYSLSSLKSEQTFSKLIDNASAKIEAMEKTLDVKINSVITRLDRSEGRISVQDPIRTEMAAAIAALQGSSQERRGQAMGHGEVIGYIVAAVTITGIAVAMLQHLHL
jgi:hypothetical protein